MAAYIMSLLAQSLGRTDHALRLAAMNVQYGLDLLLGRLGVGMPACGALYVHLSGFEVLGPQPLDVSLRHAELLGHHPGTPAIL